MVERGLFAAGRAALPKLQAAYAEHRAVVDKVVEMATKRAAADEQLGWEKVRSDVLPMIGIFFALSVALGMAYAVSLTRRLLG